MLPARLRPYAKAVAPFLLSLLAVGVQWAVTGAYDRAELATQLTGLLAALVAFLVPNQPAKVMTVRESSAPRPPRRKP